MQLVCGPSVLALRNAVERERRGPRLQRSHISSQQDDGDPKWACPG